MGPGKRIAPKSEFPIQRFSTCWLSLDASLIIFSSVVGGGFYQLVANGELRSLEQLFGAGLIAAVLYVLIGQSSGFYELNTAINKQKKDIVRVFTQWMACQPVADAAGLPDEEWSSFFSRLDHLLRLASAAAFDGLSPDFKATGRQSSDGWSGAGQAGNCVRHA